MLSVRRRWPYWYSFSTTCFEHLRVQSSYFAIVQHARTSPTYCAAYFQRFSLDSRTHGTRARQHTRTVFPGSLEGEGGKQQNPRVLINVVEFIRTISNIITNASAGGRGEFYSKDTLVQRFLISAKSSGIIYSSLYPAGGHFGFEPRARIFDDLRSCQTLIQLVSRDYYPRSFRFPFFLFLLLVIWIDVSIDYMFLFFSSTGRAWDTPVMKF